MSAGAMTVMITTGGTGGHIFPGLAVAGEARARGGRVFWLGTRDGMEAKLVPQHGVEFEGMDRSAACAARAGDDCCSARSRCCAPAVQAAGVIRRRAPRRRARLRRLRVVSRAR